MIFDFKTALDMRYGLLSKGIEDIEKKIQVFPEGRINTKNRNGNFSIICLERITLINI